ncbi:Uncharacterised protein [Escherichia coli]|uniref:Uncharacterized protein n=1 Tax=Escherichia coli TaxID=562 RepID=A0A2X1N0G6_ECOLX|nr:Uncharacterised protein [Escherichia coli]
MNGRRVILKPVVMVAAFREVDEPTLAVVSVVTLSMLALLIGNLHRYRGQVFGHGGIPGYHTDISLGRECFQEGF